MVSQFVACICEGNAELAVLDVLLENDCLCFSKDDLINSRDLQLRNGDKFGQLYLSRQFPEKVSIYRILDSHHEQFRLKKAYQKKADILNVVTAP